MIETALGSNSDFTAPHRTTTKIGADVLDGGGTAVEAMVAAAAAIAVVYPHMTGIGGDGFWLIHRQGKALLAISACGQAAELATLEWYAGQGHRDTIPTRGSLAAVTMLGTVGGWQATLALVEEGKQSPLADLLPPPIELAIRGITVTRNLSATAEEKIDDLSIAPGFADMNLTDCQAPRPEDSLVQAALGATLSANDGAESYYCGDIARTHTRFLEAQGNPLRSSDFEGYSAELPTPLTVTTFLGTLDNVGPPTQGMSSLAIPGVFDRLGVKQGESVEHFLGLVEAIKQAFIVRNAELGDPAAMRALAPVFLANDLLDLMAAAFEREKALPWPNETKPGDTVWMGAADREGTVVSFIQNIFREFGSGLTCPETGVVLQNRGAGFTLTGWPNKLSLGKRPFHTLNPALAVLNDGRVMSYGTMEGEGQPQTQAAVFSRFVQFGKSLQEAITHKRWLLGKTWGDDTASLKLEADFDPSLVARFRAAGHEGETICDYSSLIGHAGAVVRHPNGMIEAANDPRSDGLAYAA